MQMSVFRTTMQDSQQATTNIGDSTIQGIEGSLRALFGNFGLNASFGYTDSELGELTTVDTRSLPITASGGVWAGDLSKGCVGPVPTACFDYSPYVITLSGAENLFSPKLTYTFSIDYAFQLRNGGTLTPRLSLNHADKAYESVLQFLERFQPALVKRVKLYTRSQPIFEAFHITSEMEKALGRKVWLKSGGYIVINQTEALVAIDVNTGRYVGERDLETTALATNLEAVAEIVRQIRLRDLGGIIVVDLIDMVEAENRERVFTALETEIRKDRSKVKLLSIDEKGRLRLSRKAALAEEAALAGAGAEDGASS